VVDYHLARDGKDLAIGRQAIDFIGLRHGPTMEFAMLVHQFWEWELSSLQMIKRLEIFRAYLPSQCSDAGGLCFAARQVPVARCSASLRGSRA
jgi:hypothetical protein